MNEEEVPFMRHSVHLERVRKAPEILLRMRPPWGTPGAIGQQRLNTPCFVWSARRPCITPRHHEAGAPTSDDQSGWQRGLVLLKFRAASRRR